MTTPNQALQTIPDQAPVPADVSALALQAALAGDLAKLSGEDRLKFYGKLCEFTGLNPLSKPFDWVTFQGKLTLYPNKGCAEQLRVLHGVTFDDVFERRVEFGLIIMTVRGQNKGGRRDFATAALPFDEKMPAEVRANAIMKLETKAKRRMTLSICGLTMFAREAEDGDFEPAAEKPRLEMPETAGDRAEALNRLAAIDVETVPENLGGASRETGTETGKTSVSGSHGGAQSDLEQSSTGANKPNESGSAEERAQLPLQTPPGTPPVSPAAVATPPTGVAEQPGHARQQPVSGPPADRAPTQSAGSAVQLSDADLETIGHILTTGGTPPPHDNPAIIKNRGRAIAYLKAKGQLAANGDLATLSPVAANFIKKQPPRFWEAVIKWEASGPAGATK